MKRLFLPVLFFGLLLAGCATEETEPAASPDSTDVVVEWPDPTNAAGNEEAAVPPGWMWRFDRGSEYTVGADADSVDTFFVTMTPGWHLTTQPSGIFYHPSLLGEGAYTASTTLHLFDPGSRNESFGIFLGGSDLQGPDQEYLYFLIRRSGEYLVKLRQGEETEELIGWTAHDAVVPYDESVEGTATNTLSVDVRADSVAFMVNDAQVATLPKGDLPTDGVVGLRVNHGLNLHIEDLSVDPEASE